MFNIALRDIHLDVTGVVGTVILVARASELTYVLVADSSLTGAKPLCQLVDALLSAPGYVDIGVAAGAGRERTFIQAILAS